MRASFPATERHLLRTEAWVPLRTKRYRSQIAAKAGRNTVTRKPRRPCKAIKPVVVLFQEFKIGAFGRHESQFYTLKIRSSGQQPIQPYREAKGQA